MDNQTLYILGISLACCILPFLLITLATAWMLRSGRVYITPNMEDMRNDFLKLKNKYPRESDVQLAQRIINKQARRAGVIGALTSVGGFFVLPFGLAIDMYASSHTQNAMFQFLAWVYETPSSTKSLAMTDGLKLQTQYAAQNLVGVGGQGLNRRIYRKILVEVAEKSLAKIIPVIGLALGYGVNYFSMRSMGEAVRRYYENR